MTSFKDPVREIDKLRGLYDSLMEARRHAGDEVVLFHKFAALVSSQVTKLREGGSGEVAFRVAVKEGKVNFTVRGMQGDQGVNDRRPEARPAPPVPYRGLAHFGYVAGLRALRTVNDLELHRLAFLERPEPVALNCREVDEHIAAAVAFDESVTLGVVEPLDLACDTHRTLSCLAMARRNAPLDPARLRSGFWSLADTKRPRVPRPRLSTLARPAPTEMIALATGLVNRMYKYACNSERF